MQIVENWTMVTGKVEAVAPSGAWVDLSVRSLSEVAGFPSLLGPALGGMVRVLLPPGVAPPALSATVALRVRKVQGGALFAHPSPITLVSES